MWIEERSIKRVLERNRDQKCFEMEETAACLFAKGRTAHKRPP